MTVELNKWTIGKKRLVCDDSKLRLRLKRLQAGQRLALIAVGDDEPLFRSFRSNRVGVKNGGGFLNSPLRDARRHRCYRRRTLVLLRRGGLQEGLTRAVHHFLDSSHKDLSDPVTGTDRRGKLKNVELLSRDDMTTVKLPSLSESFEALLDMLAAAPKKLGPGGSRDKP
jgi:hypothetical protein